MIIPSRRSFVAGLASLFAAPAIVSASSLMPVSSAVFAPTLRGSHLLTPHMISREAVRLFCNTNMFIKNIDLQYDEAFGIEGAKIGTQLRIRVPQVYLPSNSPPVEQYVTAMVVPPLPSIAPAEMAALGAAAVIASNPALSRRNLFGMRGGA